MQTPSRSTPIVLAAALSLLAACTPDLTYDLRVKVALPKSAGVTFSHDGKPLKALVNAEGIYVVELELQGKKLSEHLDTLKMTVESPCGPIERNLTLNSDQTWKLIEAEKGAEKGKDIQLLLDYDVASWGIEALAIHVDRRDASNVVIKVGEDELDPAKAIKVQKGDEPRRLEGEVHEIVGPNCEPGIVVRAGDKEIGKIDRDVKRRAAILIDAAGGHCYEASTFGDIPPAPLMVYNLKTRVVSFEGIAQTREVLPECPRGSYEPCQQVRPVTCP